jgi:hypothetical protein
LSFGGGLCCGSGCRRWYVFLDLTYCGRLAGAQFLHALLTWGRLYLASFGRRFVCGPTWRALAVGVGERGERVDGGLAAVGAGRDFELCLLAGLVLGLGHRCGGAAEEPPDVGHDSIG